tara:strand:+ start:1982 stop:2668 length:687 start_codon:yes stop_codon:yes gene_type:complete
MTFIIIFVILLSQHYFKFAINAPWRTSALSYIWSGWQKLATALSLDKNPGSNALGFIVLAMLVVVILHHLLGFVAAFVLLWFSLDAYPGSDRPNEAGYRLRHLFAIWFWFVVLGIYPAMLYVAIVLAIEQLPGLKSVTWYVQILSLLEWIPARLLGLSLGLVSSLMPVFVQWLKDLRLGLTSQERLLNNWAELALKADADASLQGLLARAGLLWLVILALLSIGAYVV